jgi:hypothetical protein
MDIVEAIRRALPIVMSHLKHRAYFRQVRQLFRVALIMTPPKLESLFGSTVADFFRRRKHPILKGTQ